MKIVATTSLPAVDRPNGDRWNAARSCQFLSSYFKSYLSFFSGCQLASLASHQAKVTRPMVPMPTGVLVVPMLGSVSITKSCSAKQSAEVGQTSSHENQNPKLKGHQVGAREGVMYAEVGKTSWHKNKNPKQKVIKLVVEFCMPRWGKPRVTKIKTPNPSPPSVSPPGLLSNVRLLLPPRAILCPPKSAKEK